MLNEILNIYDSGLRDEKSSLTQTEAIYKITEKINLLINHFNLLEYNTNKTIDDFDEKISYYLNDGLVNEVSDKLDQFVNDGTLDGIINQQIFEDINNEVKNIKNDLVTFKETYFSDKDKTKEDINKINKTVQDNSNEISRISSWVSNVEDKVGRIQNDYVTIQTYYPSDTTGYVQRYILEDNKMCKLRKHYIVCQLSADQWKKVWEYISGGGCTNNNGSIWIPFYWGINKDNVIDTTLTLKDINKWNWQSLGHSKIGVYGLGGINNNGCYVYIENKDPSETTIGVNFTLSISELY